MAGQSKRIHKYIWGDHKHLRQEPTYNNKKSCIAQEEESIRFVHISSAEGHNACKHPIRWVDQSEVSSWENLSENNSIYRAYWNLVETHHTANKSDLPVDQHFIGSDFLFKENKEKQEDQSWENSEKPTQ